MCGTLLLQLVAFAEQFVLDGVAYERRVPTCVARCFYNSSPSPNSLCWMA